MSKPREFWIRWVGMVNSYSVSEKPMKHIPMCQEFHLIEKQAYDELNKRYHSLVGEKIFADIKEFKADADKLALMGAQYMGRIAIFDSMARHLISKACGTQRLDGVAVGAAKTVDAFNLVPDAQNAHLWVGEPTSAPAGTVDTNIDEKLRSV